MKKWGIIERLVVGKPRTKDFEESDLPNTRWKQFSLVMRTRWTVLLKGNLLAGLFWLLLLTWDMLCGGYVQKVATDLTVAEYGAKLLSYTLLQYGTEIPLYALAFTGLAGLYYLVRCVCWGEPIKVFSDFGKGMKDSGCSFALLGLVFGFINAFVHYMWNFALLTLGQGSDFVWGLALAVVIIICLVGCVALMYALCMLSLYKLTAWQLLKNSFIFTFKKFFSSLGVCLCSLLPVLVFAFMPWAFVQITGYCVLIVFSLGFMVTVQTLFCHGVFDTFINAKSYPDYVGMGLASGKIPAEESGILSPQTSNDLAQNEDSDKA
jgi:uncharacterized membrane protein YesL